VSRPRKGGARSQLWVDLHCCTGTQAVPRYASWRKVPLAIEPLASCTVDATMLFRLGKVPAHATGPVTFQLVTIHHATYRRHRGWDGECDLQQAVRTLPTLGIFL
jgi:hypothetical protein